MLRSKASGCNLWVNSLSYYHIVSNLVEQPLCIIVFSVDQKSKSIMDYLDPQPTLSQAHIHFCVFLSGDFGVKLSWCSVPCVWRLSFSQKLNQWEGYLASPCWPLSLSGCSFCLQTNKSLSFQSSDFPCFSVLPIFERFFSLVTALGVTLGLPEKSKIRFLS